MRFFNKKSLKKLFKYELGWLYDKQKLIINDIRKRDEIKEIAFQLSPLNKNAWKFRWNKEKVCDIQGDEILDKSFCSKNIKIKEKELFNVSNILFCDELLAVYGKMKHIAINFGNDSKDIQSTKVGEKIFFLITLQWKVPKLVSLDTKTNKYEIITDYPIIAIDVKMETLSDNEILFVGGRDQRTMGIISDCYIFNINEKSWKKVADYPFPTIGHDLTMLKSGHVISFGGSNYSNIYTNCYIYDPIADNWVEKTNIPEQIANFSAETLENGNVILLGGHDSNFDYKSFYYIYDPENDSWNKFPFYIPITEASLCKINGNLYSFGGKENGLATTKCFRFIEEEGFWERIDDHIYPYAAVNASCYTKDKIFIVPYFKSVPEVPPSFMPEIKNIFFDVNTNEWIDHFYVNKNIIAKNIILEDIQQNYSSYYEIEIPNYPFKIYGHRLVRLDDKRVLSIAGHNDDYDDMGNYCFIYDLDKNSWESAEDYPINTVYHAAVRLNDGRVLGVGGLIDGEVCSYSFIYDPTTNNWSGVSPYPLEIFHHDMVTLNDGRVLSVGGSAYDEPTNKCYIYDPETDTWTQVADYPKTIEKHSLVKLKNGKVLSIGGFSLDNDEGVTKDCYLYDPETDTWSQIVDFPMPVSNARSTLLKDGKVFLTYLDQCFLYDPVSNVWSFLCNMPNIYHDNDIVTLINGEVLSVGGAESVFNYFNDCIVYNPELNSWDNKIHFTIHKSLEDSTLEEIIKYHPHYKDSKIIYLDKNEGVTIKNDIVYFLKKYDTFKGFKGDILIEDFDRYLIFKCKYGLFQCDSKFFKYDFNSKELYSINTTFDDLNLPNINEKTIFYFNEKYRIDYNEPKIFALYKNEDELVTNLNNNSLIVHNAIYDVEGQKIIILRD